MMRVEDETGDYFPHPDDPRVLIQADAKKNEKGKYRLLVEGKDDELFKTVIDIYEEMVSRKGLETKNIIKYPQVQALLPATPSAEVAKVQARNTACLAWSERPSHGSTASGSTHCRPAAIVQSAARRLPSRRVTHEAGKCTSCAAKGSAPSSPISTGGRSR